MDASPIRLFLRVRNLVSWNEVWFMVLKLEDASRLVKLLKICLTESLSLTVGARFSIMESNLRAESESTTFFVKTAA